MHRQGNSGPKRLGWCWVLQNDLFAEPAMERQEGPWIYGYICEMEDESGGIVVNCKRCWTPG